MAVTCIVMRGPNAFSAAEEEFTGEILPILEKTCFDCHNPEKHKGDLVLTAFTNYTQVTEARETWQKALEMVQAFEMPPKGKKELNFGDHGKLLKWLRRLPKPERTDCDQIASDRTANFYKGYVMSRRLNRAEYHNTLRDLLGIELHLENLLPADGGGGEGFDTSGSTLFTSSIHIEKYLAAAEYALEAVLPNKPATLKDSDRCAESKALASRGRAQNHLFIRDQGVSPTGEGRRNRTPAHVLRSRPKTWRPLCAIRAFGSHGGADLPAFSFPRRA